MFILLVAIHECMCWHELIPSPTRVLSLIPMNSAIQHETPSVTANTLFGFIRSESPQNDKIKWWSGSTFSNQHNDELRVSASCREENVTTFFLPNQNIADSDRRGKKSNQFHRFNSLTTYFEPRIYIKCPNLSHWTFMGLILFIIYIIITQISKCHQHADPLHSLSIRLPITNVANTLSHTKKNCQTSQPEQYH